MKKKTNFIMSFQKIFWILHQGKILLFRKKKYSAEEVKEIASATFKKLNRQRKEGQNLELKNLMKKLMQLQVNFIKKRKRHRKLSFFIMKIRSNWKKLLWKIPHLKPKTLSLSNHRAI